MTRIPIEYWHEAQIATRCGWEMTAKLAHVGTPVTVLSVRRLGESNFEVLSDVGGWQRAVEVWTEQKPRVEVEARQGRCSDEPLHPDGVGGMTRLIMKPEVQVGQIWKSKDKRETRYIRIDSFTKKDSTEAVWTNPCMASGVQRRSGKNHHLANQI